MQAITILGATGSIGQSTLDVVARHADRYRVFALSAHSQVQLLAEQCLRFQPQVAVLGNAEYAAQLQEILQQHACPTEVAYGVEALCAIASSNQTDMVMAAIVGAAGLAPSLAAAKAGKKVLLANKEALVMSGQIFIDAIAASGASLLPIDSEHNAIFQCLPAHYARAPGAAGISKIVLTASGGPFRTRSLDSLANVTPAEAVAHPNWVMGRKISVDSATMMNKGLEVIEAHWLFAASAEQIEVVIHPQSVIHSMVSYVDGSVLAQLGNPDMRTPIANAMAYPERIHAGVAQLDLTQIGKLEFEAPDLVRFPCLRLAFDALRAGGSSSVILNAANEIAVQAFLDGKLGFRQIDQLLERVLASGQVPHLPLSDLESLLEQDRLARQLAQACIDQHYAH